MTGKELIKLFQSPPWGTEQEAEQVARSLYAGASDLVKILDVLTNKKLASNARIQQIRCIAFFYLAQRVRDNGLFVPYVRALKNADSSLRQVLVQLIPLVNSPSGHGELCALLRHPDVQVYQSAAQLLKQVGGRGTLEHLQRIFRDTSFPGLSEALDVATSIGKHRALPLLKTVVQSNYPQAQILALCSLGDRGLMRQCLDEAADVIVEILEGTSDQYVLEQAIKSYAAVASEEEFFDHVDRFLNSSQLRMIRAAIFGMRWFPTPRSMIKLDRKLQAGPESVSLIVLETLEEIGTEAILPPLLKGLSHSQLSIRNRAGQALAKLGAEGKVDIARAVIWLLRSSDTNARRIAVDLAGNVEDPEGHFWPKLLSFLHDDDWWIRERVTDALMKMMGHQLTRYVVGYLSDPSDVVRRWAIDVLMHLQDPQALGAIYQSAQHDSDWWVREKAVEALGATKDRRVVPYILELMKEPELHWSCIRALELLEAREAAAHVAGLLQTTDSVDIQLIALQCLDTLNDIEQANAVMAVVRSPNVQVRKEAFELLKKWEFQSQYGAGTMELHQNSPLDRLLLKVHEMRGEDLIIAPNRKPYVKCMGKLVPLSENTASLEQIQGILMPHLSAIQIEKLENLIDIDFSYKVESANLRFRVNVFHQHGGLSAVFRAISGSLLSFEDLGLPQTIANFGKLKHGLVVVGGPTGSGKSTTLGALIDSINRNYERHIISLEDPIEIVHKSERSLITQREIGTHTSSFTHALRATLRQDPDVILVGEMRDLDAISFAITAAETGHLVFGTLHTVSAESTVDRMINAFPAAQHTQVRSMLAQSLRAVVCQFLLRRKDQPGRCLATEIMINNGAISNLIRKSKQHQIPSTIGTSRDQGMQLMDADLMRLYRAGMVYGDEVYMKAKKKSDFEALMDEGEHTEENMSYGSMEIVVGSSFNEK